MSDNKKEPTYDYSEETQIGFVAMFLFDSTAFVQNSEVIQPESFDNPILAAMIKLLKKFYAKWKKPPSSDEFLEELVELIISERLSEDECWKVAADVLERGKKGNFEWLKNKVVEFAQCQGVKQAIISGVGLWKKRQYGKILTNVREALAIGEAHDYLGSFYYRDLEPRLTDRREGMDRSDLTIPTTLESLNKQLGGGLAPGEVGILMGPTKRGKTIVGVTFVKGAMLAGKDAIHFMFEGGSEPRCQRMYDATFSGVPKSELKNREEEVRKAVNDQFKATGIGQLVVKHFPPKPTVLMLENHLQKLRIMENFSPSLLLIDYLGLMKPTDKNVTVGSSSGRYYVLGEIIKEFLSLAQRYGYAIWLLHQATRAALSKQKVDLDDSAESWQPMQDADLIISLNQTKEEGLVDDWQPMRIFIAGGREMRDRWTVNFKINKDICQLAEADEEA